MSLYSAWASFDEQGLPASTLHIIWTMSNGQGVSMRLYLYSLLTEVAMLQTGIFVIGTNKACGVIDLYAKPSQQN